MTGQLFFPPTIQDPEGPMIFLAGPIQGALDWQSDATKVLRGLNASIHIANPRRDYLDGEFDYAAQVDWETHFLRRTSTNGVVLFWLANEHNHIHERAYAQTTRFELAEWKVRHERDDVKLVVGIDENFSNARYIRRRFSQDCPNVPLTDTLEASCEAAFQLITT